MLFGEIFLHQFDELHPFGQGDTCEDSSFFLKIKKVCRCRPRQDDETNFVQSVKQCVTCL